MITNYFGNKVLMTLAGMISSASLGSVYVGLSTTAPSRDGSNVTEPTGNGYERVVLGVSGNSYAQRMTQTSDMEVHNKEIIYFPEATGSWGTCTHFCLFDAKTGGNLVSYGSLSNPIAPTTNNVAIVRVNELSITLE